MISGSNPQSHNITTDNSVSVKSPNPTFMTLEKKLQTLDMRCRIIGTLQPGHTVGEISMISCARGTSSVFASKPCNLVAPQPQAQNPKHRLEIIAVPRPSVLQPQVQGLCPNPRMLQFKECEACTGSSIARRG